MCIRVRSHARLVCEAIASNSVMIEIVYIGDRGFFKLVEVWVENKQLLELFPPEFLQAYLNLFSKSQNFENAMNGQSSVQKQPEVCKVTLIVTRHCKL